MFTLRAVGHVVNYGIGFASESKQYFKEKKATQGDEADGNHDGTSRRDGGDEECSDSQDWDFDDAGDEYNEKPPSYEEARKEMDVDETVTAMAQAYPGAFKVNATEKTLPHPVVLPQRRPNHRSRGFVRAYAPILGEHKGIDQDAFLSFLEEFDRSIKTNPVFDVINVASFIAGLGSMSVISIPITFAVQFAANTGKEMQRRWRTNTYIDNVNEKLFKPHGLFCMVITYKPAQSDQAIINIDVNETAAASAAQAADAAVKKGKNFRNTEAGKSKGDFSIPESAPLVYPELDKAAAAEDQGEDRQGRQQFSSYRAYMSDYLDRRRQAKFAVANPNNPLSSLPDKPFASTFADPNHQMYHHGPINMVTGGRVDLWAGKRQQRVERAEAFAHVQGRQLTEAEKIKVSFDRGFTTPAALVRRVISQDALYLVICNLPTEEEIAKAKEQMESKSSHQEKQN